MCRWYFRLQSSSTPRNREESLTGMLFSAILMGGIEAKDCWGEVKTTNFVLDAFICNIFLVNQHTNLAISEFNLSVKDVMLLAELKMVVSSAYSMHLDEERQVGKSLI